jgi:hypothetical protein
MTEPVGDIHPRVADRFDGYEIPDLPARLAQPAVDATIELIKGYPEKDRQRLIDKVAEHGDEFIHHLSDPVMIEGPDGKQVEFNPGEHHGWGMWFRNWLRHTEDGGPGITDDMLPVSPTFNEPCNWDDYYTEIVCEAVKRLD